MDGQRLQARPARHRVSSTGVVAHGRYRRLVLSLCLCFGAACGSLYLYGALSAPNRSPLLLLSASYAPSWDLNPWAGENSDLLRQMDRRSLTLIPAGDGSDIANGRWTKFDEQILAAMQARAQLPLLIYINLHGAVDDGGEPRLIPPLAEQDDPRTWISLRGLLEHLHDLLSDRSPAVVLMLESSRFSEHTPASTGAISFATAVQRLLAARADSPYFTNLHVLLSSADEQPTASDWNVGCDLFTRELARGLHGAADQLDCGGNHDGYVQFSELSKFVAARVSKWSQNHRGSPQTIWAWSSTAADTALTWRLSGEFQLPAALPLPEGDELEEIDRAWRQVSELQREEPWVEFPGEWQLLCNAALGLEQAVHGGRAARVEVPSLAAAIQRRATWLRQQLQKQQSTSSIEQQLATAQAAVWRSLAQSPTVVTAQQLITPAENGTTNQLAIVPVLHLLAQDPNLGCWKTTSDLSRYAGLRSKAAALQAQKGPAKIRLTMAQCTVRTELQQLELQIDDSLLADRDTGQITQLIDVYQHKLQVWEEIDHTYQRRWAARDRVIASLPEIARCLTSVMRISVGDSDRPSGPTELHRAEDQLVLLAVSAGRVSQELASEDSIGDGLDSADLEQLLQPLRECQDQLWEQLLRQDLHPSPRHLARLHNLVNYAWFPRASPTSASLGLMRAKAWARLREWEHRLDQVPADASGEQSPELVSEAQRDDEFLRFFVACVSDRPQGSSLSAIELRSWLRRVRTQTLAMTPESLSVEELDRWHRAELEARLAGSIAGTVDEARAVRLQRDLQAAHRCLNFAEETLGSFWASPRHDGQLYCSWLSSQAIDEARALESKIMESATATTLNSLTGLAVTDSDQRANLRDEAPAFVATDASRRRLPERIKDVSQLLGAREQAARTGLVVRTRWLPDWQVSLSRGDQAPAWDVRVAVAAGETFVDVPAAIAAVNFRTAAGAARKPLSVDRAFQTTQLDFRLESSAVQANDHLSGDSGFSSVSVTMRGHEFHSELSPRPTAGRTIRAKYARAAVTSLEIREPFPGPRHRTFILDCSASMARESAGELTAGGRQAESSFQQNKLDAAKLALLDLLEHMRGGQDQVSVLLYGHRVAQGTTEQGILRQTKYLDKFPLPHAVEPYEDVEIILPMGRFGDAEFELVREHLSVVLPWGQSPLYWSLSQALDTGTHNGEPHDIVLISDGRNYQFNAPSDKRLEVTDVVELAQRRQATLHFIGFGVPDDQLAASSLQFEELAQGTGGTVTMQVADASLLSQRLAALQNSATFQVLLEDGSTFIGKANEPLTLPAPRTPNAPIAIDYGGKSHMAPLNVGSALRFTPDVRGHLISLESEPPAAVEDLFDNTRQPTGTQVGIYHPQRVAGELRWKVSLRSRDGQVPPRPHRVLVELQPRSSGPSRSEPYEPYVMVGDNWVASTPLPMLEFTTTDWPADAQRAQITVWIMQQAPPPEAAIQIEMDASYWRPRSDIEIRLQSTTSDVAAMLTGVDGASIADWGLWMNDPHMSEIVLRNNRAANTSLYYFRRSSGTADSLTINPASAQGVTPQPTLELFSLTEFKQHASRIAEGVELELPRPLTALAPTPNLR